MIGELVDCKECIYRTKCRDVDFQKLKECIDFRHRHSCLMLRLKPGDTVWVAWPVNNEMTIKEQHCKEMHVDKQRNITYICEDIKLVDSDFGFKAFLSLRTAEMVLDLRTDWGRPLH